MLIFPNLILLISPFPVNDGMRLFLWALPYFCIIPGLTIYYLIENFSFIKPKITLLFLSLFITYFLYNFLTITPYHYTYLNILNGKNENRYKKFENDYWATSIDELIKKADFKTDKVIKITTCGFFNNSAVKLYLKNRPNLNYKFVSPDDADYVIMTNRVSRSDLDYKFFSLQFHLKYKGIMNCFDIFKGNNIADVKRNGLILSIIRKIKA